MADLSFDDLIPRKSGELTFDDLIPKTVGKHLTFEEGQALLEQEDQSGLSGAVGAGLTSFIDQFPVAGSLMRGGAERAAAGVSSLIDGESYGDNLAQAQRITQAAQDQHPYVSAGAGVAGAVTGTLPMIAAAPSLFGAGAGGLMTRSLISAASGAALGGADSAVRSGGDLEQIKEGMGYGGGAGLLGPVAGKVIGGSAQKVWNALTNRGAAKAAGTTAGAVAGLDDLASREGLDAAAMQSRLSDLGPEGMIMDLGPGLQGRAGGIVATPGEGQAIIRDALAARQSGANTRISSAVDDSLGANVVPSQLEASITEGQQRVGNLYLDAFRDARGFDTGVIADDLDRSIDIMRGPAQRALQQVRGMLNVHNTNQVSNNPQTLFQTRNAIDGMLDGETNTKVIGSLKEVRQQLDDALRQSVPRIKEIDAQYAELARQREALTRGQSVLDHGRTAPRPSELTDMVTDGVQPQGMSVGPSAVPLRLSQGARAEVDRILGSNANDVQSLHRMIKSEGDWNRDRLATLFGDDKANRLFKVLENERLFADTNQIVTRNSETARRVLAASEGRKVEPDILRQAVAAGGITAAPRALAIKAGDKVMNALMSGRREATETEIAKVLSSRNQAIIDALELRQSLPRNNAKADAVTRALFLGGGTSRAR